MRQTVLPLWAGLTRLVAAVWIIQAGIGAAERTLLAHNATAEILRRMNLTHKALVALRLLPRNLQRQGGEAPTRAGPDRKTAGALGEKSQPRPGAVVDLDPSHFAVGVGIEFYRDIVGCAGGGARSGRAPRPPSRPG